MTRDNGNNKKVLYLSGYLIIFNETSEGVVIIYGRGVKKVLTQRKGGGGSKKFLNLNTMSKKEDSENAISNDLETQNFQNFPARCYNHCNTLWESGPLSLTSFQPPE